MTARQGGGRMTGDTPLIHVIDDDDAVRLSLELLLQSAGYDVACFARASEVLAAPIPAGAGCALLDVRMPEMDGLALQERLAEVGYPLPIIMITGHADVPVAVRALKAGAVDFIEKPFDDEVLLRSVEAAVTLSRGDARRKRAEAAASAKIAALTPREREVLEGLVAGHPNKTIAYDLGISPRTVEIHRAHIMDKMSAGSLSELVRMAIAAGVAPGGAGNG